MTRVIVENATITGVLVASQPLAFIGCVFKPA